MSDFIEIPASKTSISMRKPVCGIGINDADYILKPIIDGKQTVCPFYRAWSDMIKRCYSQKLQRRSPCYIGCTVTKSWLIFTNFKSWMKLQNWQGMQLDKDIKVIGNKIYSPDTCLFVSPQINSLLLDRAKSRGACPIGVSFHKRARKFIAQCRSFRGYKHLGLFLTEESAHEVYKEFKKKVITDTANLPENEYIREYLLKHAELLRGEL